MAIVTFSFKKRIICISFLSLNAIIHRQFYIDILKVQFDRGMEYTNTAMFNYLKVNGITIIYITTCDFLAHDVAECLTFTLLNDCRTPIHVVQISQYLWYYAVQYAIITRNFVYNTSMKASPSSKVNIHRLDTKTNLLFDQQAILHLPKTISREKRYSLSSKCRIIQVSNLLTNKT